MLLNEHGPLRHAHTENIPLSANAPFASLPLHKHALWVAAVPTAKRAQTLVMPGTLQTHQTSDDMLASTSESLSASHPVGTHSSSGGGSGSSGSSGGIFGGNSGSASEQQHQLTAASFDNTMSADTSSSVSQGNTLRTGKMLETQPGVKTAAHHHASNGR